MKYYKRFKFDVTKLVFLCIVCAIVCLWPENANQSDEIELYPVETIQQELLDRGHDIKVDGKWGPNTQLALDIEMSKN